MVLFSPSFLHLVIVVVVVLIHLVVVVVLLHHILLLLVLVVVVVLHLLLFNFLFSFLYICTCIHTYCIYNIHTTSDMVCTICLTGLQVKVSDKRRISFDFVWAPFHQPPRSLPWQPLALYEITSPHLRLHRLTESDELREFLSVVNSIPATQALVLINSSNHYRSAMYLLYTYTIMYRSQ